MSSAPMHLNVALFAQLTRFCGLGDESWLDQFIFGFPPTGVISQTRPYPTTDKTDSPNPISTDDLPVGAQTRFKPSAARPPPHAAHMRNEALDQVKTGCIGPPSALGEMGRFSDAPSFPTNNAFHCAAVQGGGIRVCGDLKAPETNRPCSVNAPISPPSRAHVAQISSDLAAAGRDLTLGQAGESDAYKNYRSNRPILFCGHYSSRAGR